MDSRSAMIKSTNFLLKKARFAISSAALFVLLNTGFSVANDTDAKKYGVNAIVMHNTMKQPVRIHAKIVQSQNSGGEVLMYNHQFQFSPPNLTDENLQKINNIASSVFKASMLERYWSSQSMYFDINPESQGKMVTWTRGYDKNNKLQIIATYAETQDTVVVECQQKHSETSKWSCSLPVKYSSQRAPHFHTSIDKNNEFFSVHVIRNSTFLNRDNYKTYNFNSPKIIFFTWQPFNQDNHRLLSSGDSSDGVIAPTAPPPYALKF